MSDQPRSLSRAAAAVLLLYLLVRGVAHAPMLPAGLAPWMPYIADGLFLVSLFLPALWGIRAAPSLSEAASAAATAAKVGAFLLVFLAPSMAFASPAIPSAGRGWMIVTGCMAILGAVVGLLVAACRLVERRQRRRAGLLVLLLLAGTARANPSPPGAAPEDARPQQAPSPQLAAAPAQQNVNIVQPVVNNLQQSVNTQPNSEAPPPAALDPRREIASGASSPDAAVCAKCASTIFSKWKTPEGRWAIVGIVLGSALQVALQVGVPVGLAEAKP